MDLVLSEPKVFFNIAAFFLTLPVLFFSLYYYSSSKQSWYFTFFICTILLSATMETVRTLSYHYPYAPDSTYLFPRIIQSVNFITTTTMLLSSTLYFNSIIEKPTKFSRVFVITNISVFIIYSIICLMNIRLGWIVSYDPTIRKYDLIRGPLYSYVGYGVPIYMVTMLIVVFIYNINYYSRQIKLTMLFSLLSSSVFMVGQPFVANYVSIVPFGTTVTLYIWFLALENGEYKRLQKVNAKLSVAQQEAVQANKAKNAFLSNMSHEIRTPMNVILGLNEMILNSNDPQEITQYANNIHDSGKNLLSIINNILDYSQLEFNQFEIVESEYHLWDFLENVKTEFSPPARLKGLSFSIDVDETLPDSLFGDSYHITQVLRNLILNSIKYTPKGSVLLRIRGTKDDSNCNLVFEVEDTGDGIRNEDLLQLFHGFQHLESIQRDEIQGIGLGLAICHKLVTLLGGSISFETKKGVGTRFTVTINQKVLSEENVANRKQHTVNQAERISREFKAPNCNVLIVDDNSINLIVASGLLKKTEAKIHTCESGRTCLELMKRKKYDIIFLDHFMPEMDGVETFKRSLEMPDNLNLSTPVVILTANYTPKLYEYYSGEGFADYIYKPIDRDRLYEVFFRIIPKNLIVQNK
ncbi:MAG: response regulator [Treponema sp.]|nr:response regulator [Treponema sp.]